MKRIAFIPIDNRPVCYTLAQQIAAIDDELELLLPERNLLGDLKKPAEINAIFEWLEKIENIDYIILSLDTLTYGGLVSSRKSNETYVELENRINKLKDMLQKKSAKVLAFSSIMRISNNNINEEEKEYWSKYGTLIFDYSFNIHKLEKTHESEVAKKLTCCNSKIPPEILADYLETRERNFEINKLFIQLAREGIIDTLVFSKDDCAQFGLNMKEAEQLKELGAKTDSNILIKTGADEIPLSLLSRAVLEKKELSIFPIFTQPHSTNKISKYEDISVADSVKSQLELAGAKITDEQSADIILLINNFDSQQGELVMNVFEPGFQGKITLPKDKPFFIADILNANGADNNFVEEFFYNEIDTDKFCGYSAWNTTGNTLGSGICAALVNYTAKKKNKKAFRLLQLTRFLDDWAYQANVRKAAKQESKEPNIEIVKNKMRFYEKFLCEKLKIETPQIEYKFPWERYFEIEILIKETAENNENHLTEKPDWVKL